MGVGVPGRDPPHRGRAAGDQPAVAGRARRPGAARRRRADARGRGPGRRTAAARRRARLRAVRVPGAAGDDGTHADPARPGRGLRGPPAARRTLLAALGEPVPWVRVVVDRTGADILASPGWRPAQATEVVGDEQWPLRRVDAGGWLQPRFQRSAIVSWDRNAAKVAEAVVAAAERVNAETLLVAGDRMPAPCCWRAAGALGAGPPCRSRAPGRPAPNPIMWTRRWPRRCRPPRSGAARSSWRTSPPAGRPAGPWLGPRRRGRAAP